MGRSGLAAANLLSAKGFRVLVSDTRRKRDLAAAARGLRRGILWEGGGHSRRLLKCRFVVKSPGIAPSAGILGDLRKASVPVFGELETALAFCKARDVVAVTGTNGKTTTTLLTAAAFKAAKRRFLAAGNLGTPVSAVAAKAASKDALILEVSSYQLEDSRHFRPSVAAILNISPDHIDHHGSMSRYIAAKARVFRFQSGEDVCVFNADDPVVVKLSRQAPARKLFFSLKRGALSNAWIEKGRVRVRLPGRKKDVSLAPPVLPGEHNLANAMAAALMSLACGLAPAAIQKAFKSFRGVEHRIEDCGTAAGMLCINDSKATNVESTLTALKALSPMCRAPRIFLILGGLHKGFPYVPIRPFLGTSVKAILTIGAAARKVEEDLGGAVPLFPCRALETAVETALQVGSEGDILLLSPACASFDQFKDFEDRGRRFKELVERARRKR